MRALYSIVALSCAALLLAGCSGGDNRVPSVSGTDPGSSRMTLSSSAFGDGEVIPGRYARDGENASIPIVWNGAPGGTRSYALLMIDLHPSARKWVHWMVVDIPADTTALADGASGGSSMPEVARELKNSFGRPGYGGPQPPPGSGVHPYAVTVYALDVAQVERAADSSLAAFLDALSGHVLAQATYEGVFGE